MMEKPPEMTDLQAVAPQAIIGKMTSRDVRKLVPISDVTLWRWVRDGIFPQPEKINGRKYWSQDAVAEWMNRSQANAA